MERPGGLLFSDRIRLEGRVIAADSPCFIIAEAGVNHNGDLGVAEELVRQAKHAGADCVKFQTFTPRELVTTRAPKAAYQLENTDPSESQLEMLEKLKLPAEAFARLKKLCSDEGIVFLSTPYTFADVDFLDEIGACAFKVASAQLVEPVFLRHVASKGKPMIVSTGMGLLSEVGAATESIRLAGNRDLILLQCTTNYPAPPAEANLSAMGRLRDEFGCLVGYSDHTASSLLAAGAVALGAKVVEKHFTLDKAMPGPDHSSSADPAELRSMVESIRTIEAALGDGIKRPSPSEARNSVGMRRSVVARRDIRAGDLIGPEDLALKRPCVGIPAAEWDRVLGRKAKTHIMADSVLNWADLLDE